MIKEVDLAYYAGLFDGEGCIQIVKTKTKHRVQFQLWCSVGMTNYWILADLQSAFKGAIIGQTKYGNRRASWIWRVVARQALTFLMEVLPYLKVKKSEAELAIKFQRRRMWSNQYKDNHDTVLDEAEKVLMSHFNKRGI